jgi:hypothetical protein
MAKKFNPFTRELDFVNTDVATAVDWGNINGTLFDQTDLQNALDNKADLNHTHIAADITDFDTEVSNNVDVASNTLLSHQRNQDEQLRGGLVNVDPSGNTTIQGDLGIKVYVQGTEPILSGNKRMAIWEDIINGYAFLIYRDSTGVQKLVELN